MTERIHNPDAPARRDEIEGEGAIRGTARMEAFADGVFAIAFTLPVMSIVMPSIRNDGAHARPRADRASSALRRLSARLGGDRPRLVAAPFLGRESSHTGHWFVIATTISSPRSVHRLRRAFRRAFPDAAARPQARVTGGVASR